MENNLLVFGTKNFNNSLSEIKEYLNSPLVFFNKNDLSESSTTKINFVIVDSDVCNDIDIVRSIKKIKNKPLLLLKKKYYLNTVKLIYDDVIILPSSLIEISRKISKVEESTSFKKYFFLASPTLQNYL